MFPCLGWWGAAEAHRSMPVELLLHLETLLLFTRKQNGTQSFLQDRTAGEGTRALGCVQQRRQNSEYEWQKQQPHCWVPTLGQVPPTLLPTSSQSVSLTYGEERDSKRLSHVPEVTKLEWRGFETKIVWLKPRVPAVALCCLGLALCCSVIVLCAVCVFMFSHTFLHILVYYTYILAYISI